MDEATKKALAQDSDGLTTYEYIANHIDTCGPDLDWLADNMGRADLTGQFVISAARYLYAIDPAEFAPVISKLIAMGIDKDRERRYIGALMKQMYGEDYREKAAELSAADNNFRRIYKRLFPEGAL